MAVTTEETLLRDFSFGNTPTPSGDLPLVAGKPNLQKALMRRLVTTPRSLVTSPPYGVGIKQFQNAPPTFENQRKIAARIKEQFEKDFRVNSVTGVQFVSADDTPWLSSIKVNVDILGVGEQSLLFNPFDEDF